MPEITPISVCLAVPESGAANRQSTGSEAVKVLYVINGEHYAGAERVQDLLAHRLPESGYEVLFACVKPGKFAELRTCRKAPLFEFPMRARLDVRPAWSLARLVREEGVSLVHAHTPRSLLVARPAAFLAGVPLVYHVHSPTSRDTTHSWRNRANAALERFGIGGARRLIAVSTSLGEHVRQMGVSPERVAVVHNGVPLARPAPRPAPMSGLWTLGTVALFRPRKGLEVLLEALGLLRQQKFNARLRAIGAFETPEYKAQILRRARELGIEAQIDWVGFTKNVAAELAQLDLFVLPSLFGEGLPMVVLEAMAAGAPVVATRVEGVPEAIRDGLDGLLAIPGDPPDLARQIGRFISGESDWSAMRESALRRHAELFSDESMARGVARIYDEVLNDSRA